MPKTTHQIHEVALLRLWQIIGDKKTSTPPLLPIGRTTFLNRVKDGTYPQPVRLGARTIAWRASDIWALLEKLGA
ncbi:MAG: AlpA family phage regulatory protein [Methylococcales bacterium]|nr:AlpA family phage regulatory protein [Methylococcales bacterium]